VRIPKGSEDRFSAAFPDLYRLARAEESRPAEKVAAGRTHRMKRGETLSHLANRYGVSVSAIRAANGNISPQRVRAGQVLAIPTASSTSRVASATATTKVADTRYHRVRAGESLWTIARRYDVSVTQLQAWNDMGRRSTIRSGQRLRVSA
jgi:membrane-bound lytic murein transglycosylase D